MLFLNAFSTCLLITFHQLEQIHTHFQEKFVYCLLTSEFTNCFTSQPPSVLSFPTLFLQLFLFSISPNFSHFLCYSAPTIFCLLLVLFCYLYFFQTSFPSLTQPPNHQIIVFPIRKFYTSVHLLHYRLKFCLFIFIHFTCVC